MATNCDLFGDVHGDDNCLYAITVKATKISECFGTAAFKGI